MARKNLYASAEDARKDVIKSVAGINRILDTFRENLFDPGCTDAIGHSLIKHIERALEGLVYITADHKAVPEGTEKYPRLKDLEKKGQLIDMPPYERVDAGCLDKMIKDAEKNGVYPDLLAGILESADKLISWITEELNGYGDPVVKYAGTLISSIKGMKEIYNRTRDAKIDCRMYFRYVGQIDEDSMTDDEIDELYRPRKMNSRKSMLSLFIYLILKENTDWNHHYTQEDIKHKLLEEYELKVDRGAIGRTLETLSNEDLHIWSAGRDIEKRFQGYWYSEEIME